MKVKRFTASLLAVVLILSAGFAAAAAPNNAAASGWADSDIQALNNRGILTAEFLDRFQEDITRGEFTALILSVYEYARGRLYETTSPFTDIASSGYASQISKAYSVGLVGGRSETVFDPGGLITREEAAKMLCTLVEAIAGGIGDLQIDLSNAGAQEVSQWALPYVSYVQKNGLMQGTGNSFSPRDPMTREQALVILERAIETYEWHGHIYPQYRALVIGNFDYAGTENDGLRFKTSADDVSRVLKQSSVRGQKYQVEKAYNVSSKEFFQLISDTFSGASENDVSILSFSGHGVIPDETFSNQKISETAIVVSDGRYNEFITYPEIIEALNAIPGTKIVLLGSCFSGAALNYTDNDNIMILAASADDEYSYGYVGQNYTYNEFEFAISEALGGSGSLRADYNGDGRVTFEELFLYLRVNVNLSTVKVQTGEVDIVLVDTMAVVDGG